MLTLGLAFAILAVYAQAGQTRATGPSSVLAVLSGRVELAHGAAAYATASDGETVNAGDRIRTDAEGRAVVTFFDGSTVEIAPASDLTIEAAAMRDGAVDLVLSQAIGRTFSSVHKLLDPRSRYEIHTPSLTAAVRGTKFEVEVAADGSAAERTTEGLVAVSSAGSEVLVPAGAATSATPGAPPAPPAPIPAPTVVPTAVPTAAAPSPRASAAAPTTTPTAATPLTAPGEGATPDPATAPPVPVAPAPVIRTAVPPSAPSLATPTSTPVLAPLPSITPLAVPTQTVLPLPSVSLTPLPSVEPAPAPSASLPVGTSVSPLPSASALPTVSPLPSPSTAPVTTVPLPSSTP